MPGRRAWSDSRLCGLLEVGSVVVVVVVVVVVDHRCMMGRIDMVELDYDRRVVVVVVVDEVMQDSLVDQVEGDNDLVAVVRPWVSDDHEVWERLDIHLSLGELNLDDGMISWLNVFIRANRTINTYEDNMVLVVVVVENLLDRIRLVVQ